MKETIKKISQESLVVQKETIDENLDSIVAAVEIIVKAFQQGRKLIIFGNGGSAADSQHIAAEFIGRFQKERKSLPAISLTTDTSILTSLGNDYGFDIIFARQLEGLGVDGDIALAISTSGNSQNILEAVKVAKGKGIHTISFTGNGGGRLASLTDIAIVVPSKITARIQEAHISVAHCICELVENNVAT